MEAKNTRLRELDFLRGIAIVLVLLNHQYVFKYAQNMGWIGVDLFFVLSGFLVSGLLFKEFNKFGNIKPTFFLIRRGFKIYPIYYLAYPLYLYIKLMDHDFSKKGIVSDLLFVQNYIYDWSYAFPPSWSLAVEEHFYVAFSFFLFLMVKKNSFRNAIEKQKRISKFEIILLFTMLLCLIVRVFSTIYFPENEIKNTTMSHLRIDSLLAGVLVSYSYYYRNNEFQQFYLNNKFKLMALAILLLSFTPFTDHLHSFFIKTIGFTCLYVSFSIILIGFLCQSNINVYLNRFLSKNIVNTVSKIGYCSYSIYIIHTAVFYFFGADNLPQLNQQLNPILLFFITFTSSVLIGFAMTNYIEKYFLNSRDKLFPSRVN